MTSRRSRPTLPALRRSATFMLVAVIGCFGTGSIAQTSSVAVPGRTNATPSIVSDGRFVVLTWGATKDAAVGVYAATSRDAGRTFGAPVRVDDAAGQASVGGEQPPRVTLVPRAGREPSI